MLVNTYHSLPDDIKPVLITSMQRFKMYDTIAPQLQPPTGPDAYPPRPQQAGHRVAFTVTGGDCTFAGPCDPQSVVEQHDIVHSMTAKLLAQQNH
jgi:hypothetical protein